MAKKKLTVAREKLYTPPENELPADVESTIALVRDLNTDHHVRMSAEHNAQPNHSAAEADARSRVDIVTAMIGAFNRFATPVGIKFEDRMILELGAGYGGDSQYILDRFKTTDYLGLEVVPHVAESARDRGINIVEMAIEGMGNQFDDKVGWVYSRHVMEHLGDLILGLANIYRSLAPFGVVGAVTPHYFPDSEPAHIQQLTIDQWCEVYRRCGFTPVYAVTGQYACLEAHIVCMRSVDVAGLLQG